MHQHESRPFSASSSANQNDSFVMPPKQNRRIVVNSLDAQGGTAGDLLKFYRGTAAERTTVETAAAVTDVAIQLVGDDDGNLGGVAVTTNDFLVVSTDKGWQLLDIATVVADAANDRIDITAMTAFDGGTGLKAAVAVGASAYIVRAADITTFDTIGSGVLNLEDDPFAGEFGAPLVAVIDSQGAAFHNFSGSFRYVENAA